VDIVEPADGGIVVDDYLAYIYLIIHFRIKYRRKQKIIVTLFSSKNNLENKNYCTLVKHGV